MWEEIMKLAIGNGLWAALSCALLGYLLRDSRRREQKYIEIIESLAERMKLVDKIKEDTETLLSISALRAMPQQAVHVVQSVKRNSVLPDTDTVRL